MAGADPFYRPDRQDAFGTEPAPVNPPVVSLASAAAPPVVSPAPPLVSPAPAPAPAGGAAGPSPLPVQAPPPGGPAGPAGPSAAVDRAAEPTDLAADSLPSGIGTPCPRCSWLLVAPPGTSVVSCPRCHWSPEVVVQAVHSRVRATPTTFGPVMRSVLSLIILAPPAFDYWAAGPGGLTFCIEWMIFGFPVLILVWAKGRVR